MTNIFRKTASITALAFAGIVATAQPAVAQDAASGSLQPRSENGRQIYDAAQFSRFSPRTALDMAEQIPGFIIDSNDDDERGLGQADQNVLINGARISGKNITVETALARISATNVLRLEIVDGATLSITGLSGQVLNLVTSGDTGGGISGNFKWEPLWRRSGSNWLNGEASISGPLGKGNFTISLENDAYRSGGQGPEQIRDGQGSLLFERDEIARFFGDEPKLTASYNSTSDAGSIFNISGAYGLIRRRESVSTLRTQAATPDIFELFRFTEREWNAEFSTDYEFDLGGGRLKLIGLQRFEHSPTNSFFGQTFTDGITPANGSQFVRAVDEGETVLRGEYGWQTSSGTDWGFSLEGAYNFLDSEAQLALLDNQGLFQPVATANTNSKVTEYRGELIGSYGRALADNLTLQATLGGEYSQISQSGINGQTRSFIRPKGSVSLAWRPSDSLDVSLKVEREVGQLDFSDFVASVDVVNNANNAGNPGLVPPQSWTAELETTKKLGNWGSATVTIYGEKISDIVDAVPVDTTRIVNGVPTVIFGEARGNLPNASRYGVKLVSTILFDPIGWTGAKLDIEAEVRKSSVRDPLTGVFRRTVDDDIFNYEIELRHDIPNSDWAWGGSVEDFKNSAFLRLDQINEFDPRSVFTTVFVEHKNVFGLTVNASLRNLLNRGDQFTRTAFVNRRDGPIDFIEDRTRKFGLVYRLTVSGSF